MEVQVNKEKCEGCGDCISVCPTGAISLVNGIAEVNKSMCTYCQLCIKACTLGAISIIALPTQHNFKAIQAVPEQETIIAEPVLPPSTYRFSSVLSSVGSAILPRLVNILINAFERHLTQGDIKSLSLTSQNHVVSVRHGGRGYQHRIQGGRHWYKTNENTGKIIKKGGE